MSFVDCGAILLSRGGASIDAALMADAIHPTAAGWERFAQCLAPTVNALMQMP